MAESAEIIDLADYKRTHQPLEQTFQAVVRRNDAIEIDPPANETRIDDLYAGDTPIAQLISQARKLLAKCDAHAKMALRNTSDGDRVASDNEISLLQADLPELFCCRQLSDGFGSIILGLFHALKNRSGAPLDQDHIFAISETIEALYNNPFMPFTDSLDYLDKISNSGLNVEPPEAEILGDFFGR